ncbi:cell wall-binding protein Cwp14, partial [Clostridioides difficile]
DIHIEIIRTPHMSNFTDFNIFETQEDVSIRYVDYGESLGNPDRADRNETNGKVIEKFYTSNKLNNVFVAKDGMKNQNQLIDALAV